MSTDKLWTAIRSIESQLNNLKGELIDIDEETKQSTDEAYQRGLEEGKKATYGLVADASSDEYQRGLDTAWEAARKIVEMSDPPYWELFDEYKENLFGKISASEAIEKLKAYEEQKADDEIKVGDEVEVMERGIKFFVTKIYEEKGTVGGLNKDGEVRYRPRSLVKRTGNHLNIPKILEEMQA